MATNSGVFNSSIVRKVWMSLTGLFLCSFLLIHLLGNLTLMGPEETAKETFNAYAHFMTTFPLIKAVSYLLYFSILFHAVWGIMLEMKNRSARPVKYAYNKASANSIWASRNMGLLGTIILVFIVTHMYHFWYVMHWGDIPLDNAGNKDLYTVVIDFFRAPTTGVIGTVFYVFAMAALGFHLYHGFQSGFQTLGVNHRRYTPMIKKFGAAFSVIIPLAFAIIPIYILLLA
jgi:succinate dehydrogenase / fumarate reductase cytochrome b subunit